MTKPSVLASAIQARINHHKAQQQRLQAILDLGADELDALSQTLVGATEGNGATTPQAVPRVQLTLKRTPGGALHISDVLVKQAALHVVLPKSVHVQIATDAEKDPKKKGGMKDRVSNTLQWLRKQEKADVYKVDEDNSRAYWGPKEAFIAPNKLAPGWTIAETLEYP